MLKTMDTKAGAKSFIEERNEIFEREALPHYGAVYTYAFHLTRKPDAAEDLTQQVFMKAIRAFHQYKPGARCRAWLFAITRNEFYSGYRRDQREPLAFNADLSDIATNEDLETKTVQRADLENSLGRINPTFREAVVYADIKEIPLIELSKGFGIPIGTIKSRHFRGREDLCEQLVDYGSKHNLNFD